MSKIRTVSFAGVSVSRNRAELQLQNPHTSSAREAMNEEVFGHFIAPFWTFLVSLGPLHIRRECSIGI